MADHSTTPNYLKTEPELLEIAQQKVKSMNVNWSKGNSD